MATGEAVAVAIPTCRRPEMLAAALASLDGLVFDGPAPAMTVVVVDNDPGGSAAATLAAYEAGGRWPLVTASEARPGVVHVRNRLAAMGFARAERVAWLDDDERATPGWLAALLEVQRRFGADVVAGPVVARFEGGGTAWVRGDGADLHDSGRRPTGARVRRARAGNLLLTARARELAGAPLFDARYARSGGEDHDLLARLEGAGATMVWADEALVEETVPRSRQGLGWLLRRFFAYGAINAAVDVAHGEPAWAAVAEAAARATWGLATLPRAALASPGQVARALRNVTYAAGLCAGLARHRPSWYGRTDRR